MCFAVLIAMILATPCKTVANNFLDQLNETPTVTWGFIDKTGRMVIPAKFDDIGLAGLYQRRFCEGLCAVKMHGKWGYIDHAGKWAIPARFDEAGAFHDGLAYVCDADWQGFINQQGKLVIKLDSLPILPWMSVQRGDFGDGREFHDGRAPVRPKKHNYGYIDRSGKLVIQPQYFYAAPFSEGLAVVCFPKTQLWGFIDKNGKQVIAPTYRRAQSFHDGVAVVDTAGKRRSPLDASASNAVIDKTGRVVFDCSGKMCDPTFFSEGVSTVEIYSPKWRSAVGDHSLNHWGVVDKTGKVLFQLSSPAGNFAEGLAAVADGTGDNHHLGYIDHKGKWVIKPQFDFPAFEFSEGLAAVAKNGKAGYIDKSGKFVIAPTYATSGMLTHPASFSEGLAAVPVLAPEKGQ